MITRPMLSVFAAGLLVAATTAPADAASRCPDMRTLSGDCVSPGLAQGARRQAIDFTQQKLSYTAPPRLPGTDYGVLIARDWNEMLNLFTFPPVGPVPTSARRP
jgi:hypothetical protein